MAQANLHASSNVVHVEAGAEGLSKAAKDLKTETQRDKVEGRLSVSTTYGLSAVTNTIGYTTGTECHPTKTGLVEVDV